MVVASSGIAGGYSAKMLGDAGAEVVLVETAAGHPLRNWRCGDLAAGDGALFAFLHHGHRSVVAPLAGGPPILRDVLATSDIVVIDSDCSLVADGSILGPTALAEQFPHLVVVSISPYGLDGPFAGRPWSDLVVQAEAGSAGARGRPDTPPLQMGGHVTEWVTGAYAAVGALAALRGARRHSCGELVDVSMLEVANTTSNLFGDLMDHLRGRVDLGAAPPPRTYETPSIEPTLDGYVGFNTNTRLQFEAFLLMIERADLLDDAGLASVIERTKRWDEWTGIVRAWTATRTTAEIVDLAVELRIPVAPVADAPTLLAIDHMIERGVYLDDPTGRFLVPRRPWTIDCEPAPPLRPAPSVGADTESLAPHTPVAAPPLLSAGAMPAPSTREVSGAKGGAESTQSAVAATGTGTSKTLPLDGIRVLDMTAWWAGPSATAALATLGAEVIHVESTGHPDGMRMAGGAFIDRPAWWERSAIFLQANANKLGITLDLTSARGRDLLLELVAQCDVLVENFTPRVLQHFNLGWDVIHAANPRTVMVRMPAFGLDGPWRDRPGFAQTMEQATGLAWVTGFADDQPRIQRGPCDPNAGMHSAFATMVALQRRDRTGVGSLVEVPMVEAALNVAAEVVIEWTAYGRSLGRDGNRSWRAAPQGIYRCAGHEHWLALSIQTDAEWASLGRILEAPDLASDPRLASVAGRRARHDELDARIGAWAAARSVDDAVSALVAAGIPGGQVVDPRRTSQHPQLVTRRFTEVVEHPIIGETPLVGLPFRFASVDRWVRSMAPTLGQHNAEVLGVLLGVSDDELSALESAGVIGTRPKGQ